MFIFLRNLFYILFLLALSSYAIANRAVTRQEVESFIEAVDGGFKGKDIVALEGRASDSLEVIAKINNQEIRYTKEQYLALLEEGWAKAESYSYEKLSSSIDFLDRNKAIVHEKVLEKFTINKNSYSVISDSVIEIQLIDGELVATRIEAETSSE